VQLDRVPSGTLADLRAVLRGGEYHVFHFIGHGRYDPETQDGVLALEGPRGRAQLVSGSDLGALLHDERSLRLAVLNSCEGARGGISDPYSGTAQSLVYQGIPAVVAMQFEITDSAAIAFAHSLYATVADGYPLDAALAEARNAIREQPNPVEWATPVLYLRAPDGRIFDIPATAPAPPAPPEPPGPPGPREPPPPPAPGRPPTEPGEPSLPHRRAVLVAGAIVVALAAATVGAVLFNSRESPSGGGSSSSASVFPSPYPPAPDLPQGSRLPDSTLVVPLSVAGNTDLYLLDTVTGDNAWPLVTTHGKDLAPLISPNRTSIVYAHEVGGTAGYELRVVATDGSGDRPLFARTVEGCASPRRPAWNVVDPRELAVACYPYQGAYVAELRVMTLTGETIRTLPAGVSLLDDVSFSPDGTAIVYWGRNDPGDDGGQLYAVPADGSGPARQLTDVAGNADADFSPSGDEIAFRRVTPDGVRIYVMAADGSGEHAVTDAGWVDQDPTWSPDGNWIGFKSNRAGVVPGEQFWIIDRNGEGLRQLGHYVDGVADNAPAWGYR
jgi:hypothetical protein